MPDDVAEVEQRDHRVRATGTIGAEPHLQAARLVLDVRERSTAQVAQLHDPTGDGDDRAIRRLDIRVGMLCLIGVEQQARLIHGRGGREVDTVGRDPARGELVDLAPALCKEVVGWHAAIFPARGSPRARRRAARRPS